jgi:hypothetical protein
MSTTKAKGTAKTESIIGASANKMETAVKNIIDASSTVLPNLVKQVTDLTLKIADGEEKVASLQNEYKVLRANQEFELMNAYRTDRERFVSTYLAENKLVSIDSQVLSQTQQELQKLKADFATSVKEEITKAEARAAAQKATEMKILDAEYRAKEAENKASITQLTSQLEFVQSQAKLWKESLDKEREAGTERQKHSAVGSINLGQAGK